MYLKSLEIQGFKSFPDKTVLHFGHDISAIVGPNGSGKSNLSDAIRWVMGEQSTRTLRGTKMEDVIFGGTQKRAQVGFAEASLVLDNSDGALAVDANEVMVTRRYYRSGESEYYINRQSARLKDINELFMDTGLGREGYSNISQGRIDEILSVKSTDRRYVFEEAAGISRFRHRKEETERRLERTEENLLRIGDKLSELELQLEPLRKQAEQARKFLSLRDTLKGLEVAVWLRSLERLSASAKKADEDYSSAQFILSQAHEDLDALYQTSERLAQELRDKDVSLEAERAAIAQAQSEAQELASQLTLLQGEERNTQENLDRLAQEQSEQDSRSGGILSQMDERRLRLAEIDRQTAAQQEKLQALETELQVLTVSAEGITKTYLELRSREAACTAQLAAKAADVSALNEALSQAARREEELAGDQSSAQERQAQTQAQLDDCRKRLFAAREEAEQAGNTLAGYRLRQKTREDKAAALQKQLQELTVRLDTVDSRLSLFREMEREYEGYSGAVKFVMQQAQKGALQNIYGPISRLIRTQDQYSIAIETALGAATQHIVVKTQQDAKQAIRLLKNRDQGRATFLPLNAMEPRFLQERGIEQCRGFVGLASALVECEELYRPAADNLLARTVICESLDDAIAMAQKYHSRFRIVTLGGQVMNAGGSMTGGSVSKNAGMLSRANELRRLSAELTQLQAQKQQTQAAYDEAVRAAEQVRFETTDVEAQLREAEDRILRLEGEEKQHAVLLDAISEAAQSSSRDLSALLSRKRADEQRKTELIAEQEALTAEQAGLQAKLDAISLEEADAGARGNALSERMTEQRVAIAALAAERSTALDALRQLEALSEALQSDKAQKQALAAEFAAQLKELRVSIEAHAAALEGKKARAEHLQEALQQSLVRRAEIEASRTGTDRSLQKKNNDIIDMERESARLETRRNTAQIEERQLIDKLWDSYALTPSTAPEAAAAIENVTAAERRISELRRQLHALGTPNLGAIDEFARVNERYGYLSEQRDDVLQSKKELEGIIRDLTRHMTETFTAEFTRISKYFSQTFVEMFGGGKASLELEDPAQPLVCGIEIRVQPPGKQLKTITLLSGGEKAFVAIALYFAILKVRPTPFCMLDEIDAALDDPNVRRFAGYLRQLCKKTQFIVITHRRGTMEEADALFGVTMQEQGVSKVLQLDLHSIEQQVGAVS